MDPQTAELVKALAAIAMVVGMVGTVAPVVPGPSIVWLGAVAWAWADGFARVGWPTLLIMAAMAVLAELSDVVVTVWSGRRTGAAWSSLAVAAVAAVLGFVVLNLPGAAVGAFGGLIAAEARRHHGDYREAWRRSRGLIVGYLLSTVVQVVLVLTMALLFAVQAFG